DPLLLVGIRRELALLLVDPEEIGVALRLPIQALERAQRLGVLAILLVHRAVRRERVVDAIHLFDEDASQLDPQHDLQIAIPRRAFDGALIALDDAIPRARGLRSALEIDRRLLLLRRELERRAVPLERLLRIANLALVERGHFTQKPELRERILFVPELHLD